MSEEIVALQRQVTGLSRLHQLQKKLRESQSVAQIGFLMVNDTQQLVAYRQAVWWQPGKGVSHASGLVDVEKNSPYIRWWNKVCAQLSTDQIAPVDKSMLSADLAQQWDEFLPAHALAMPVLLAGGDDKRGLLVLARDLPWQDHEIGLLSELADIYRFALRGQRRLPRKQISTLRKRFLPAVLISAVVLSFIPIRITVLAPAEVVAKDPLPVRAPYEGVVEELHVRPNQSVKPGDLLMSLDGTDLENRLLIARQALQIANTEFRQVAQQAVFDEKGKLELAIRRGMVEKSVSEVKYLQSLLQRTEVRATAPGIVVLSDATSWIGRPVALGEQVMTLADPALAELRVELPVRDAIPLEIGSDVRFFMNISPDQPLDARLNWLAYKATENDQGQLSYSGRAHFDGEKTLPRIGLRGTARLYGDRAPVIYYLLRRPLAALRQWVGF
ncbi:efflux RND transporter periplasmic adaptor subunit [Pontibacterium sp.]|uniref:efflux RND transporter periplasmic adaptor subunit n=1 Tax=Pontibacterium sp. TaxID=2036026 RepID=UPI003568946B